MKKPDKSGPGSPGFEKDKQARPACLEGFRLEDHFSGPRKHVLEDRFVKTRRAPSSPRWLAWLKRLRTSRSRREMLCYETLQKIGVPCPGHVRISEERSFLGFLKSSRLSMELIPHAVDLRFLNTLDCFARVRKDVRWRRKVVSEVAGWIRHMHDHGIFNTRLHFGNILVVPDPDQPRVRVYFVDVMGGPPGFFSSLERARMKDIAYLYPDALKWCTPRERILFMHAYLGTRKLSRADRRLVQDLEKYALGRKNRFSKG